MKNKITAPKKTTIRGQPHKLAYINDAEEGLLMSLGGTGEMVNGVPAFADANMGGGWSGTGGNNSDTAGGRSMGGGVGNATGAKGYNDLGISPGQSQAQFGDDSYAGMSQDQAIDAALSDGNEFAQAVANSRSKDIQALQDLNKQLYDLSKRQKVVSKLPSMLSKIAQQNISNLTMGLLGKDLSMSQAFGFDDYGLDDFNPSVSDLVAAQQNAITDSFGNVVGISDDNGNLQFGRDPNDVNLGSEEGGGERPQITEPNPLTGVCADGYIFDDDLQACRLDTGSSDGDTNTGGNFGDDSLKYYRPTILDNPSQFDPDPQRFTNMNNAFIDTFAYNPAIYKKKMDITGFVPTPNSGLLT